MEIINEWDSPVQGKVRFTLTPTDSYEGYKPITQSYALCLNKKGEILLGKNPKDNKWSVPGGTVEKGEDPLATLHREFLEEVDATLDKVQLLAVQRADFLETKEESLYQLRFVATLKELKEQTPDPDYNLTWERRFVPLEDFSKYVTWPATGDYLVKEAKKWFEKNQ